MLLNNLNSTLQNVEITTHETLFLKNGYLFVFNIKKLWICKKKNRNSVLPIQQKYNGMVVVVYIEAALHCCMKL